MKTKLKLKPDEWTALNDLLVAISSHQNLLAEMVLLQAIEKIAKRTVIVTGKEIKITFSPAEAYAIHWSLVKTPMQLDDYRTAIVSSILPILAK